MRSRTSFFNRTVFWSDQRRFWPLTAGYTLAWLLLPLSRLTALDHQRGMHPFEMLRDALDLTACTGYWVACFTAVLFAMAAFSYLTNVRATNGLHALPARRETLYVTHYLAGLCPQVAAQLLAVLLAAAVLASHGAFDPRATWLMLLSLVLPTVFFYGFAVFCMTFTGQILAAPVFYGVLNVLVVGVETLVRMFAGNFLYGWADSTTPTLTALSPITEMVLRVEAASAETPASRYGERLLLLGLDVLCIYAVVGLVFAALGLLVYRKRHSESTGSTVAIGWAKPVFKYGVALCTALALGQLFYYLFFGQYRSSGDYSLPGTLLCMAAAGLIGYFVAEMLLKKSFRVFKSGWKGAAAVTAAVMLLGVVMSFDLTGYESYVPDASQVESAHFNWYGSSSYSYCSVTTHDAETLRLVTQAHRAIARDKARQLSADRGEYGVFADPDSAESVCSGTLFVRYQMKNGDTVTRRYEALLWADELSDPASPASAMTALYNAPGVTLQRALDSFGDMGKYDDPRALPDLRFTGGHYTQTLWSANDDYLGEEERELTAAEAKAVYEAVLRDVDAGRADESLFGAAPNLRGNLELYATYRDETDYSAPNAPTRPDPEEDGRRVRVFSPCLTKRMTETLAVLKAMDIDVKFD